MLESDVFSHSPFMISNIDYFVAKFDNNVARHVDIYYSSDS